MEVSPTLISTITDAVLEDVRTWQSRPLVAVYPILYFDCLFVKSRQEGVVKSKAVYVALGVTLQGEKELLGLWISETEGAKFWLSVFTELQQRGVQDCFVACVDGLAGLPEALETIFPHTQVQLCVVHKVRHSLQYVVWKECRTLWHLWGLNACRGRRGARAIGSDLGCALSDDQCDVATGLGQADHLL